MAKRDRPLLHVLKERNDPGLYCEDLAWYYQSLDAASGYRSAMGSQVAVLLGVASGSAADESNHYTDEQTHPSDDRVHFARGRRIWRALQLIDGRYRMVLQAWYEHRQNFPPGYDKAHAIMQEQEIRSAHAAYRLAAARFKWEYDRSGSVTSVTVEDDYGQSHRV
jgi:hypothetical protein